MHLNESIVLHVVQAVSIDRNSSMNLAWSATHPASHAHPLLQTFHRVTTMAHSASSYVSSWTGSSADMSTTVSLAAHLGRGGGSSRNRNREAEPPLVKVRG